MDSRNDATSNTGREHQFVPRLGAPAAAPPFNPALYFIVSIVGGLLALGVLAIMNLKRITQVEGVEQRTKRIVLVACMGAWIFLLASPTSWWDPLSTVRWVLRLAAVGTSVLLFRLHKGPALGMQQRHDAYQSVFKVWWQLVLAALAQAVVVAILAMGRGVI